MASWIIRLSRETVRKPWAMVVWNGDSRRARSGSVWIHWWSPVRSAKRPIISCVTMSHGLTPASRPIDSRISSVCIVDGAGGYGAARAPSEHRDDQHRLLQADGFECFGDRAASGGIGGAAGH